jgi:NTP pyrophosphatase (non-canonical NTP hydrolase)
MDLNEYQEKARTTAIYKEVDGTGMIYAALGIVGECGEVADKIKKMIRDDNWEISEDRKNGIKKELGDCFWYLANICCDTGHDLGMLQVLKSTSEFHKTRDLPLPRIAIKMSHQASLLAASLDNWHYQRNCESRAFSHYASIPHTNIIKLTSRKDRGKLGGDGDDR